MYAKINDFEIPLELLEMVTLDLSGGGHITGEALLDIERQHIRDALSQFHEGQAVSLHVVSIKGERLDGPQVLKKLEGGDVDTGDGRKYTFHIFFEPQ
jgi:hypothetical protein